MTTDYTTPTQPSQQSSQPPRSWWSRNWKWFVPVGCLGLIVLCLLGIAGIVGIVFGAMKSSDVYKEALQRAQNHPEVQAALGTPIEAGWIMTGNINVDNSSGTANIRFPISGPKGEAWVHAEAAKDGGAWRYSTLEVQIEDGAKINLLSEQPVNASNRGSRNRAAPGA